MLLAPSRDVYVLRLERKTFIGADDALPSPAYVLQSIDTEDERAVSSLNALRAVLNARSGLQGISNSTPHLPAGFDDAQVDSGNRPDLTHAECSAPPVISEATKGRIANALRNGDDPDWSSLFLSDDKVTKEGLVENGTNSQEGINVHALGENREGLLEWKRDAEDLRSDLAHQRFGDGIGGRSTVQASLKQSVFELSSVFDSTSDQDAALFGLSGSFIEDTSDNESEQRLQGYGTQSTEARSELDIELDAILGGSEAFWNTPASSRAKWWGRDGGMRVSQEADIWAVNDTVDVTDFADMVPEMAVEYPFDLDVFQKRAVYRLERDESVFVAAHTSAGKTVVAEVAIALAKRHRTKVIYCSPIKTLSNQKYRDFLERFGDVGIITGDVSINPDASCLVMTTEILRSMLYKGADLIRDLSHVIFDEVHYLNDSERGVVWEECIILLPAAVNIVMLSATVPNALEFAAWVGRTKRRTVYVVTTYKRPVPLMHALFCKGDLFPLYESSRGQFLSANYRQASERNKETAKNSSVRFGGGRNHSWMPIVKYIQKHELDPAIFFCFSKRRCDEAAEQLRTQDLTSASSDKNQVHLFYQSAISRLSAADRNVPQVARHREMLKRGIGVHHAGVLPIIKEITEVLFQKGLVRILFATETFAMGVNMPARTVVFTAIQKYDGESHRVLEPGEYVQMAGRAGRRGLDDVGTVLLFPTVADFPTELEVKTVLTGAPKPLRSQFRLTYNMILNLLRIDELRVEDVMSRSFSEAPAGRNSVQVKKLLDAGQKALEGMQGQSAGLERYREFYHLSSRVAELSERIGAMLSSSAKNSARSGLSAGRLVVVTRADNGYAVAMVVKVPSTSKAKGGLLSLKAAPRAPVAPGSSTQLSLRVLMLRGGPAVADSSSPYFETGLATIDPTADTKQFNVGGLIVEIRDVPLSSVVAVCSLKESIDERGLAPIRGDPKLTALSSAAEALRRFADSGDNWTSVPSLHPRHDLGLQDLDVEELWQERTQLLSLLNVMMSSFITTGTSSNIQGAIQALRKEAALENKLGLLKVATSDESLELMPDYRQRILLLSRLGYIEGNSVRLKGRAACEVNTCESLVLIELVFENILHKLSPADMAALLSALVFQESVGGDDGASAHQERLRSESEDLYHCTNALLGVLGSIGTAQAECGLPVSPQDYMRNSAKFGLVAGVRAWANGKPFVEVCAEAPDVAEGTIVRTVVRLCELLREAKNVGRIIGDPDIQSKAEEGMALIKRDVIFAASLYIQ